MMAIETKIRTSVPRLPLSVTSTKPVIMMAIETKIRTSVPRSSTNTAQPSIMMAIETKTRTSVPRLPVSVTSTKPVIMMAIETKTRTSVPRTSASTIPTKPSINMAIETKTRTSVTRSFASTILIKSTIMKEIQTTIRTTSTTPYGLAETFKNQSFLSTNGKRKNFAFRNSSLIDSRKIISNILTTTVIPLCQYNTGTKLNNFATGKLVEIGSYNFTAYGTDADACCISCNLNPNCDFISEFQYHGKLISNCAMFTFTDHSPLFITKLKNGDYYDSKSYISGFVVGYSNRFLGFIYK